MMEERLLQFIWQFQYFNLNELETTAGDSLLVMHVGQWNNHQGPDFNNARVRISDKIWAGNVELHIRASDWHRHEHHTDVNYENVILHVVWTNDDPALSSTIPTLVLEDRIPMFLLQQYESWMNGSAFIPCAGNVKQPEDLLWVSWKERLLVERLQRKCEYIKSLLSLNNDHWEQTLWWMIARNFGLSVNADAFEELARSLPLTLLARHRTQAVVLEALLMGQAGLLKGSYDADYFIMLQKEYHFYQKKYCLKPIHTPVHFLRMRTPCISNDQTLTACCAFAYFGKLFSSLLAAGSVKDLGVLLEVTANDFWHYHYTFGRSGNYHPKILGAQMINNIIVNTAAPIVFAYGYVYRDVISMEKAMHWLTLLAAENNSVTQGFAALGVRCRTAGDSQALIELKTQYCEKKRCLDCAVGNSILGGAMR